MFDNSASDLELKQMANVEIEAAFTADQHRLGSVYRCIKQEMTDPQIQVELDLATVGSIGHAKRSIRAIRDEWNPPGFGPANLAKRDLSRLLREFNFSEPVRELFRHRYEVLEDHCEQIKARQSTENSNLVDNGNNAFAGQIVGGVYAWTIMTYLEDENERGQAWYRIGCSDNVMERMRDHRNSVKLPEPLILARVYSHESLGTRELEGQFHRICGAAVHERARVNNRDREWFKTNIEFLDQYAMDIGCKSHTEMIEEDL